MQCKLRSCFSWGLLRYVSSVPQSPEQLLEQLFAIFPKYRAAYDGPIHDEAPSYHSVLIGFTSEFGGELPACSTDQLRAFGALVSESVSQGGLLENVFGTCFLEHLHQNLFGRGALALFIAARSRKNATLTQPMRPVCSMM